MAIQLSVIICSYNRETYIVNALQSLLQQTADKTLYEVIIVDNNSTDNTKQVCTNFITSLNSGHNFYYRTETRQGASYARNAGATIAKGNLLCFMDDDAEANSHYVQQIIDFFGNYTDASGLGGKIIPKYIPAEPKWMSFYVSSLVGNFHFAPAVKIFDPGKYPLESNMIVTKEVFMQVGGFNELIPGVKGTLRIGGEGKDFFYKIQQLHKKIYYDPEIYVYHVVEVKKLTSKYMYNVASGIGRGERIRIKNEGIPGFLKKSFEYSWKFAASVLLGIKYVFQGSPSKFLPIIKFRWDVIKGFLGY